MEAIKLEKKSRLYRVMKAMQDVVGWKAVLNDDYKSIWYNAEDNALFATNGISLLIHQPTDRLSERNCMVKLVGEYLILEEKESELIKRYRKPFSTFKGIETETIDFNYREALAPFDAEEVIAKRGIHVNYRILFAFKWLTDEIDTAEFQENPTEGIKPILFKGDKTEYLIMPLTRE